MDSDIDPFPEDVFFCNHCHKKFTQWEDLLRHKQQQRNDEKEDHIHCRYCGRDYKTLGGEMLHIQSVSPSNNRQWLSKRNALL